MNPFTDPSHPLAPLLSPVYAGVPGNIFHQPAVASAAVQCVPWWMVAIGWVETAAEVAVFAVLIVLDLRRWP